MRSSSPGEVAAVALPGAKGVALHLLLAGILATFAGAALIEVGEMVGLVGAKPMGELLIALVLLKLYPERGVARWSGRQVVMLISVGVALGLFWVAVFAWGNTIFPKLPDGSELAVVVGVTSAVFTAPIFEEKVVRHLLLQGVSGLTNPWISAVLVSFVFAIVHKDAVIWSFIVSMVLCWLALARGVGTLQRAIVHGTINAIVILWYFTSGFGFFS